MRDRPHIVFSLDHALVDTLHRNVTAYQTACTRMGLNVPSAVDTRTALNGVADLIYTLKRQPQIIARLSPDLDPTQYGAFADQIHTCGLNGANWHDDVIPAETVAALTSLTKIAFVGVFIHMPRESAHHILERYDLNRLLHRVVSDSDHDWRGDRTNTFQDAYDLNRSQITLISGCPADMRLTRFYSNFSFMGVASPGYSLQAWRLAGAPPVSVDVPSACMFLTAQITTADAGRAARRPV